MKKIRVGLIGMGYIGASHIEALRRIGFVELYAVADVNFELARKKADAFSIPRCYATMDELIADPEIDAVHNCTPNYLHMEVNRKIIQAGKHIFGEIGTPYLIHGSYLQDWLLFDTDYNWRVEPEYCGVSRCVGDIGSHWIDLAQVLAGCRITEVCAQTVTALPVRKKPKAQVETFSSCLGGEYEEVSIQTEDYAGVLVKFENGASGVFQCSQISAGRKCFIDIEVDGSLASLHWNHEMGDQMWKGNRDRQNEQIMRNPNLMLPGTRKYSYLGAGHPEGWNDAFKNNIEAFYRFIRDGKKHGTDQADFATFEEGHYIMKLTEAIMQSGKERRWIMVDP